MSSMRKIEKNAVVSPEMQFPVSAKSVWVRLNLRSPALFVEGFRKLVCVLQISFLYKNGRLQKYG